jgi:hypothetical protein
VSLPNEVAKEVGRLPLCGTVLPPSGLSRQEASHRCARLPHIARGLLGCSLLFLFIFGLPGLFAGA